MVQRAELVAQREAVIARLAETGERDAHARLYEAEYLPLAMALMADEAEATDVLLLTVGTQPYSVALSLVRSPARVLYLVFTDQTHAVAQKALELVDLAFEAVFWRRVPAADSAAVYRVLREARRQLFYTNLSIAEIAYLLGYNDPAYFSRVFARATGMAPSAFRARVDRA